MSEEITREDVTEEDVTRKEVEIDIIANRCRFSGTAIVTEDANGNHTVDCSAICNEEEKLSSWVYCGGCSLCTLKDLLVCEALYQAGYEEAEEIETCGVSGYHGYLDTMVWLEDDGYYVFSDFSYYFEKWDRYVLYSDCETHRVRDSDGDILDFTAPEEWFNNRYYCEECDCYLEEDDDYMGDDLCRWCADEDKVIEHYCESHEHTPILFGEYKDRESFAGLGFELEVDCNSEQHRHNNEVASGLCSACGLKEDEMRYAEDGSLDYGFECISQPHTVKAFWEKQESWRKMLSYLSRKGYTSHDAGTCGLHVHVSRTMFGSTEEEQNKAIAKVFTFFEESWDDIVKISRRNNFYYCKKNMLSEYDYIDIESGRITKLKAWEKRSKGERAEGHYVALNNANIHTFEYRLGRGTLNAWSFFAWIDFVLTVTKNAKRITVGKVNTNDVVSWIGGIKETTARYMYKRGAFRKEVLSLFPEIEWETDLTDNN